MKGPWPHRLALAYAVIRGTMLIAFSVALVFRPEQMMPGSTSEPARTLVMVFTSRTILLGLSFLVLAARDRPVGLGWVFLADVALQVFDTAMSVAMDQGAVGALPAALGALDLWAGVTLLRLRVASS